ncbi:hypothetical protein YC2023_048160 [Brassica napus]
MYIRFEKCGLSYMPLCFLDLLIPMACIQAINIMCVLDKVFENGGIWVGDLSTQDNMLPLLTALTFWFTSKVSERSKQIAKLSKTLGVPYVPVTASDQEKIMASVITVMKEFIDVRKDKK